MEKLETATYRPQSRLQAWFPRRRSKKTWRKLRQAVMTLAMGWCACGPQRPEKPIAEAPTLGTSIFQLVCSRVAQKSYPADLSGRRSRAVCYEGGQPESDASERLVALYQQRERLVTAIDAAFSNVTESELQVTVKKILASSISGEETASAKFDALVQIVSTLHSVPGVANLWARWHRAALAMAASQRRNGTQELTWVDLTLGHPDFAMWLLRTLSPLINPPANNQHVLPKEHQPTFFAALRQVHQQHKPWWQQPLGIWQEPELLFNGSHVLLDFFAASQGSLAKDNLPTSHTSAFAIEPLLAVLEKATQQVSAATLTQTTQAARFAYTMYEPVVAGVVHSLLQAASIRQNAAVVSSETVDLTASLSQAWWALIEAHPQTLTSLAAALVTPEAQELGPILANLMRQEEADVADSQFTALLKFLAQLNQPFVHNQTADPDRYGAVFKIENGTQFFLAALNNQAELVVGQEAKLFANLPPREVATAFLGEDAVVDAAWRQDGTLNIIVNYNTAVTVLFAESTLPFNHADQSLKQQTAVFHTLNESGIFAALQPLVAALQEQHILKYGQALLLQLNTVWPQWRIYSPIFAKLLDDHDILTVMGDLWSPLRRLVCSRESDLICSQRLAELWPTSFFRQLDEIFRELAPQRLQALTQVLAIQRPEGGDWEFTNAYITPLVLAALNIIPKWLEPDPVTHTSYLHDFLQGPWGLPLWHHMMGHQVKTAVLKDNLAQRWLLEMAQKHQDTVALTLRAIAQHLHNPKSIEPMLIAFTRLVLGDFEQTQSATPHSLPMLATLNEQQEQVIAKILSGLVSRDDVSKQRYLHVICDVLAKVARSKPSSTMPLTAHDLQEGLLTALLHFTNDPNHGLPRILDIIAFTNSASAVTP